MRIDPLPALREAWRGCLPARRQLLSWLRQAGYPSLAAVLRPALSVDEEELDGWLLHQFAALLGLDEQATDEIVPWRSPGAAARAIATALAARSGKPYEAFVLGDAEPTLVVRPPRLHPGGESRKMGDDERAELAALLRLDVALVEPLGLRWPVSQAELRQLLLRAEGRFS